MCISLVIRLVDVTRVNDRLHAGVSAYKLLVKWPAMVYTVKFIKKFAVPNFLCFVCCLVRLEMVCRIAHVLGSQHAAAAAVACFQL